MVAQTVTMRSERNASSTEDWPKDLSSANPSYIRAMETWLYSRIDVNGTGSGGAQTISAVPTILGKIRVETALSAAGAVPLYDGTTTTTVMTLAASMSAGVMTDMAGTRFETSLAVNPTGTTTATGVILVQYRVI